jgi:hypothetical protein
MIQNKCIHGGNLNLQGWEIKQIDNKTEWKTFISEQIDNDISLSNMGILSASFPLTILVEKEYVDKDWSDILSSFYSLLHPDHRRRCNRYHLFEGKLSELNEFLSSENKSYLGYFTFYPSWPYMRGRTMLNPKLISANISICSISSSVHILGREFLVCGFPSSGQDARYISCAHVSLWSIFRYFSEKYSYYREIYHADIVESKESKKNLTFGRNTPTGGLVGEQIMQIIDSFRLTPVLHKQYITTIEPLEAAKHYLVSGIPVIILGNSHAVVGIGLTGNADYSVAGRPLRIENSSGSVNSKYRFVNRDSQDLVCVDDNYLLYGVIADSPVRTSIKPTDIEIVCIPLYHKIMFELKNAEEGTVSLLDHS